MNGRHLIRRHRSRSELSMVDWRWSVCGAVALCHASACGVTQGESTQSPGAGRLIQRQSQALIYGDDDRVEVSLYAGQPDRDLLQRVVAALVPKRLVSRGTQGALEIEGPSLGERTGLCSEEVLRDQLSVAVCSAILVEDDRFVTAGHCFRSDQTEELVLVLGYLQGAASGRFEAASVREIAGFVTVVDGALAENPGADYAIGVLVDRAAGGLDLAGTSSRLSEGAGVVVVGTSEGLPLKVDTGGVVFNAEPADFFEVTADTFTGGSGSPVFSAEGAFLGIVVGGGADYQWDDARGCLVRAKVQTPDDRAEVVVRTETVQRALADLPDGGQVAPYVFGSGLAAAVDAGPPISNGETMGDTAAPQPSLPRETSCTTRSASRTGPSVLWLGGAWLWAMLRRRQR